MPAACKLQVKRNKALISNFSKEYGEEAANLLGWLQASPAPRPQQPLPHHHALNQFSDFSHVLTWLWNPPWILKPLRCSWAPASSLISIPVPRINT